MIEFSKPEKWVIEEYPQFDDEKELSLSKYTVITEYDEGFILFHTITWSLFYMTKDEYEHIMENERFKEIHILLDKDFDEDELAEKIYTERSQLNIDYSFPDISSYIIFTTTDCNARCFYCYEQGINKVKMSSKTANDVADFIINRTQNLKQCTITWFGGEPLLNTEIIDIITDKLSENNITYVSKIISNGILANEEIVSKFSKWNVISTQITIDGDEEYYNKTKKFIYKDIESPYKTVINNIYNIAKNTKAHVTIRVNVSLSNIENIKRLFYSLRKSKIIEFILSKEISISIASIYQLRYKETTEDIEYVENEMRKMEKSFNDFIHIPFVPLQKTPLRHCMCDSGAAVSIFPDGRISNCEHWNEDNVLGDIYSGITNIEQLKKWTIKNEDNIKFCKSVKCPLLPICSHHYLCNPDRGCQNINHFNYAFKNSKIALIKTFEYYLKECLKRKNSKE